MKSAFLVVSAFLSAIAIARNGPGQVETPKPECVRAVSLDLQSLFPFNHLPDSIIVLSPLQ